MSNLSRDRRLPAWLALKGAGWNPAVPGALLLLLASPALAGDAGRGKAVFVKCHYCHQLGEGAKNSVGPVLNGIVGRPAALQPGYSYSAALKASGKTWDEATLQAFIAAPAATVPHTKMTFAGLRDPEAVDDVIAYLKQFAPDGSAVP